MLAGYTQEELIARWEEFFDEGGYMGRLMGIADRYPEVRTLAVEFPELDRFDSDLAIFLLRQPLTVLSAGQEAIRRVVPPTDEHLEIHLRIKGLPKDSRVQIRDLRSNHLGRMLAVEGLVRKSTEVRPQLVDALFECVRCGTVIKEAQEDRTFREPLECYEDQGGCKRSANATKFRLLGESSRYLDTQKIEVQEVPEGLRGGEEPQRLSGYVEDDLCGLINPGMRVTLNGTLRSVQRGRPGAKSTVFDIFLDVNSLELEQVEFEEIEVTEEDIRLIRETAADSDIFRMVTASIAPSIYGMNVEKEALALQLFGGVPKLLPDGRRIRGDIHLLLVGDPGTGKSELLSYMSRLSPRGIYATGKAASAAGLCVAGETAVATSGGFQPIERLVQSHFRNPVRSRSMERTAGSGEAATFDGGNEMVMRPVDAVWRLGSPRVLLEVATRSGLAVRVTPATKLLVDHAMGQSWMRAQFVRKGMRIATASRVDVPDPPPLLVLDLLRGMPSRIVVDVDPALVEGIVRRLTSRFGSLREAARRLLVPEDALYHGWRRGRHAVPLGALLVLAGAAGVARVEVAKAIQSYSQAGGHRVALPLYLDEDLAYFVGLVSGDGSVERSPSGGYSIRLSNSDPTLLRSYDRLVRRLFAVRPMSYPRSPARSASVRFHSRLVAKVLSELGVPPSPKSARVTVTEPLLNGPRSVLAAYLRGLFDTDGTIQPRTTGSTSLSLSTVSRDLAEGVQLGLLRFGIHARVRTRRVAGRRGVRLDGLVIVSRRDQYVVEVRDGTSLSRFRRTIGFTHPEKARRLGTVGRRRRHSNVDLISGAGVHLRDLRGLLGLTAADAYGPRRPGAVRVENGKGATTHSTLDALIDALERAYESGEWEGIRLRLPPALREEITVALRSGGATGTSLARELEISQDRVRAYCLSSRRRSTRVPFRVLEKLAGLLRERRPEIAARLAAEIDPVAHRLSRVPARIRFLRTLASGDVRWEPVATVRAIPSKDRPAVFDMTVRDAHSFVANGILVHNTAAAVRDEFGEGRWTLEAGALVLADRGLACLHPEAEVLVDGVPVAVASLFDETRKRQAIAGGRPVEIAPLNRPTVSFDPGRARTTLDGASLVVRRRYTGPILRVLLRSGFELRLTPDHRVLDGESFEWKPLEDLTPGSRLVAVQRLPSRPEPIYVLDVLPGDWIVQLAREEEFELRGHVLRRFSTLAEANRHYGLSRDALSGRSAMRVDPFRSLLRDLGLYEGWKRRPFGYGRRGAVERLRVARVTPELAYVLGFVCGDGHVSVSDRRSSVSTFQSRTHLRYIQCVLEATKAVSSRTWGLHGRETEGTIRGDRVRSHSHHVHRGSKLIAYLYEWLAADDFANVLRLDDRALHGFLAGLMDSDGCVSLKRSRKGAAAYRSVDVEFLFSARRRANLHLLYALRRLDVFARVREGKGVLRVQITTRRDANRLLGFIQPYSLKARSIPPPSRTSSADHEEAPSGPVSSILSGVRPRPWRLLEKGLWSTLYDLAHSKRKPYKPTLRKIASAIRPWLSPEQAEALRNLAGDDYALDAIAEVRVEPFDGYVYDLRVPGPDDFLCDGIVVHNCIDEIEKMNPQDRSAIHEAMEQQRISVAKAGITAVLQARCAILAAANPKFGRFDETKYVSEQIDLSPALLSRFDVIFSMIDRPEAVRDSQLADHILKGHKVGEVARRREAGFAVPETKDLEEPFTPYLDPIFLRKYVAHAKRIYPVMSDEATEALKRKYLDIRKTGEAAGTSVPITPRQLEAVIRLSEASARLRLSETVEVDDAERAIRIVEYWMGKVAGEEGRFDIDIIATGMSQSQREQLIVLRDVLQTLSGPEGAAVSVEDIQRLAEERGLPAHRVEAWLRRLKQEGEVYSPSEGKYKLVTRL